MRGACCGTPWHSKGYVAGTELMADRTIGRAWEWSERGRLPIVVDASSCTFGLRTCREYLDATNQDRFDALTFLDSVDFVHDLLLPRLRLGARVRSAAVHAVCSVHHLGSVGKLEGVAGALAQQVVNPPDAGCCGFAGDRGWLHPELTAAAMRHEAEALRGAEHAAYLSSNRTCEVGLARATGRPYRSFLFLLEAATRAMEPPAPV